MADSDEDLPHLSIETFAALQEFYKEQAERDKRERSIIETNSTFDSAFEEDWQLSQFWYDNKTIDAFIKIITKSIGSNSKIALISCPTLYKSLKKVVEENYEGMKSSMKYDARFAAFGSDFVFYDYKTPMNIPQCYSSYFDLVIADPPFLSEECLTKVASSMNFLCNGKMILCTGVIMVELVEVLLGLKRCSFQPQHNNNLANEFCCLSNFNVDSLL